MYFRIHVVQIDSAAGPRFQFSADYMQDPGRAADNVVFDSLQSLTNSMRSVRVDERRISNMRNELARRGTSTLIDVDLTDQDLAKLGLYVLGKRRFSAISAVEGLKLDSQGAERLERTEDLSSEERRAVTIQAFAQSRNRE
jgi:hypothetical protein